jgi:hypothetical protein
MYAEDYAFCCIPDYERLASAENSKGKESGHNDESDDDDENSKEDKGPEILSLDQSAITGESLAVDKRSAIPLYFLGVWSESSGSQTSATLSTTPLVSNAAKRTLSPLTRPRRAL